LSAIFMKVSKSYKEAKLALDVGKIFYSEKKVIAFGSLGIGRLIYQLPLPLCQMFISEIFGNKSPDDFDERDTYYYLISSLRTVLMYQRLRDSFIFIEILSCTDSISSRRAQDLI